MEDRQKKKMLIEQMIERNGMVLSQDYNSIVWVLVLETEILSTNSKE